MRLDVEAHAAPGVRDRQHDVPTGPQVGLLRGHALVDHPVRGRDVEPTASGHGITRVDDEVHDHLLDLPAIGGDPAEIRVRHEDELDALGEHAIQDPWHAAHDVVEIQRHRLQHLLAAEYQQLL